MNDYDLLLKQKEQRFELQQGLLKSYRKPLWIVRSNIPVSLPEMFSYALLRKIEPVEKILYQTELFEGGYTKIFVLDCDAYELKKRSIILEETHPLGRLLDLDVVTESGELLHRDELRTCFLCDEPAHECIRTKKHDLNDVKESIYYRYSVYLSSLATKALHQELNLDPKPGLVTPHSQGSHRDMSYDVMRLGIESLEDGWIQLGVAAFHNDFDKARRVGQKMEQDMLRATGGINTHKGAIFVLGSLIYATIQSLIQGESIQQILKSMWQDYSLYQQEEYDSHGKQVNMLYRSGILYEAKHGFPHIFENGEKEGHELFLALLEEVEDSNIIYRAGVDVLRKLQQIAKNQSGKPIKEVLSELEILCENTNASPGGVADLYSGVLFMQMLRNDC